MNALDWIRAKSQVILVDSWTTEDGQNYRVTTYGFRGTLPTGMATEVRKLLKQLVSSELEHEALLIGGQYRSDYGRCEYTRSIYERTV